MNNKSQYKMPTTEDLDVLIEARHEKAVTVYLNTETEVNNQIILFKLATELRNITTDKTLLANFEAMVKTNEGFAGGNTVALFVTETLARYYVLPNRLVEDIEVYAYLNLRQLFRVFSFSNSAHMLIIESSGWALYKATINGRASKIDLDQTGIENLTEANNRESVRNRDHERRLHGDERFTPLQYIYAKRVAQAVNQYFNARELNRMGLVFIVAGSNELVNEYLQHSRLQSRNIYSYHEEDLLIKSDVDIDKRVRSVLEDFNDQTVMRNFGYIMDKVNTGLVVQDFAESAKAIVAGNVSEILYDFEATVHGYYDELTGDIDYAREGDLVNSLLIAAYGVGARIVATRWVTVPENEIKSRFLLLKRYA